MAEIYRDSVGKAASLGIVGAIVSKVEFKRNGEVVAEANASPAEIPYSVTHQDGEFNIVWTYTVNGDEYTRVESFNVVTPLFVAEDLVRDPVLSAMADADRIKLESLVRKIVEAYCGQKFGYRKGLAFTYGNGTRTLHSPERIIELDNSEGVRIVNGGFAITPQTYSVGTGYNVKVPAQEEALHYGVRLGRSFTAGSQYVIEGSFGWASVPDDVKEAALLIAEELACDESMWRDRYIKSIRAADWRFDFGDGAYEGTGSIAADQILAKYVVNKAVII